MQQTSLERKDGVALQLREQLVELFRGSHFSGLAPAGHRRDHVARAHVRAAIVPDLFDDHAPTQFQVALLLRGKIDDRETEAVGCLLRRLSPALGAAREAILGQFTDRDGDLPGHTLAPHFHARLVARLGAADDARQLARARYRLAVELENDVARFHPGLFGGAAFLDGIDEGTCGLRKTERFGELLRNFLDHDTDPSAADAARLAQLALHFHGNVDGDGEGEPHKPAGAAVDLRIDSNDFAAHVEQRPAGIPRVDRDVGLNEGNEVLLRQAAALGADNARGDGAVETERRADCDDPFPDLEPVRIAHPYGRQPGGIDFDQREVGASVRADHARLEFALVGQANGDLIGGIDHMRVGENVAVGADDEARAERTALEIARALSAGTRRARDEAPEEIVERIVLLKIRNLRRSAAFAHLSGADIDDGGALPLGEIGEIGQLASLGEERGGQPEQETDKQYSRDQKNPLNRADGKPRRHPDEGRRVLLAVFHSVGDVFYALRRRFADYRDPVAAHGAHVDVDRPLPHPARLRRPVPARRRLDEYRDRGKPVGQHDMPDAARASHGANQLGHGAKSGRTGTDRPSGFGQIGAGGPRILDAPVPAFAEIARLQLIAADGAADLELRECELLHQLVFLIEGFRLEQHAGIEIRPEPVAVSHPVFRLQREDLATVAPDALDLALPDGVVLGHVLELP